MASLPASPSTHARARELSMELCARPARRGDGRPFLAAAAALVCLGLVLLRAAPRGASAPLLRSVGLAPAGGCGAELPDAAQEPPDKRELGRATWTMLHALAANYPDAPGEAEVERARGVVDGLARFYPCPLCREHFDRYVAVRPPDLSSREAFLLWTCAAHNEVSKRNRRPLFPCELTALDKRWADCGCH